VPSVRDLTILSIFLPVLSWLAAPHWAALYGYSTDVDQHIGLVNAIRRTGFVPDVHPQTTLWMQYPLGFHAFGYVIASIGGLEPATVVNLLPSLASALMLYGVVAGTARVATARSQPRVGTQVATMLLFAAMATTFASSQFGIWLLHEGTGRLAAGLMHVVPVAILFSNLQRCARPRHGPDHGSAWRSAAHLFALILSGALIVVINPTHLLVHAALASLVLLSERDYWHRRSDLAMWRRQFAAAATAAATAFAIVATDPYTARAIAARTPLMTVDDAHVIRREADYFQRYTGSSCLTPRCLVAAVSWKLTVAAASPLGNLLLGPVQLFTPDRRVDEPTPSFDQPTPYTMFDGWTFPDLSGWPVDVETRGRLARMGLTSLAPIRGLAPWLLACVPLTFVWVVRSRVLWRAAGAFVLACGIEYAVRVWLASIIDSRQAWLYLLPAYTYRASAMVFNQLIWPFLIVSIAFCLVRRRGRFGRLVMPVFVLILGAMFVSAASSTVVLARSLQRPSRAVTRADLRDLRRLEQRLVPREESYLVASATVFSFDEKQLLATDDATPLYTQSNRPALFLFHLSYGSRYSASDHDRMCEAYNTTGAVLSEVRANRARWAAVRSSDATAARSSLAHRRLCGHGLLEMFPDATAAGTEGAVTLFRLW
jgi:hypothetical protein